MKKVLESGRRNIVPIIFSLFCILSVLMSGKPASYLVTETFTRVARNSVLILSLIIPVLCGMGLNFSIVLGAMAGEVGLILITHWRIEGIGAILIAIAIATVVSIVLGYLTGRLFNKVKGQEMITGLILGYFAIGVYDLIFMCLVGTVIPMNDPLLMIGVNQSDGSTTFIGLAITINLFENTKYALDNLFSIKFIDLLPILTCACYAAAAAVFLIRLLAKKQKVKDALMPSIPYAAAGVIFLAVRILSKSVKAVYAALFTLSIPIGTWIVIVLVCLFIVYITKTKLGQDIRAVGHNMGVSVAAGINVDRTRIIATVLSTVIASWGQIIYLQNIGTIQTYYSHEQVGIYAVAAILVGGASIEKATISHVFTGALLFHVLFFTTPLAATALFGNAQLGEYFRVFFCYGIIAASLLLFALKKNRENKHRLEMEFRRVADSRK